ncbi:hypothetical protein VFPBJ_04168 [Purpureocillium lilacinum]|uniref:Uncharacterized protein n=1 Tax=Purpureocillium lilacinum TaxID=33203 RepID=A0A179GUL3_PURLI|nr:hypothetical protein VFPBJ_04168 [Purpureocillium lilacinum]
MGQTISSSESQPPPSIKGRWPSTSLPPFVTTPHPDPQRIHPIPRIPTLPAPSDAPSHGTNRISLPLLTNQQATAAAGCPAPPTRPRAQPKSTCFVRAARHVRPMSGHCESTTVLVVPNHSPRAHPLVPRTRESIALLGALRARPVSSGVLGY